MYFLGKEQIVNLETLLQSGDSRSEVLVNAVKNFVRYSPVDFVIIKNGGYRTAEQQNELFKKSPKVTNCDGYNKLSAHQSGLAVDLIPWVEGKPTWDRDHCLRLSGAFSAYCKIKGIPIISGADWNSDGNIAGDSWDPCHFEIKS